MTNIITPAVPQELIDFLHFYPMFLIVGHKEPDGDCIGSSIAMSLFLQRLGKRLYCFLRVHSNGRKYEYMSRSFLHTSRNHLLKILKTQALSLWTVPG